MSETGTGRVGAVAVGWCRLPEPPGSPACTFKPVLSNLKKCSIKHVILLDYVLSNAGRTDTQP